MSVPFMWVDGNLTLVLNNRAYQVLPDHANYKMILEKLPTGSPDELLEIVDIAKAMAVYSDGQVEIKDGKVFYKDEEVHGSISKRILEFMSNGLPFEPLVNFLKNIMENPSYQSQLELYDFLEHKHLPITEDGCFLAYKAVRKDFMDKYSGTFNNQIGGIVKMTRAKVDDDRQMGCAAGLHVGALDYVTSYGSLEAGDRIIIVKINPRDAVSVPTDSSHQKLRTCQYEVVGQYEGELLKPLYSTEFSYEDNDEEDEDEFADSEAHDWGWNEDEDEEDCEQDDDDDNDWNN